MTPDNVETGMWIDEIISQINHSCDPNAILITDGPRVSLRTLKDIKKDEQIFIAYTEPTDPYFYRQRQLKDKFFFTCRCAKCERGDPISEDSSASWPNGPPPEFREKVAQLLKERHGLRMNTTDASQEELKSVLQEKAFELCGRPDVVVLEEVDYYYHPALWPVYQQPFVILSENLISNLLSVARFMDAWKHCGIHYWKIWPKFYKQKAHPHRVVSVYKFARLAAYLSQRGATIDDHMFAISVALTVEAKELAVLSHGENNTFTRHVQEEYRRMFADDSLSPKYWEQLEQEKLEWRDLVEREYDMSYRRGPYSI